MAPTTRATTADDGLTDEVPVPEDLNLMVAEGVHFFLSKFWARWIMACSRSMMRQDVEAKHDAMIASYHLETSFADWKTLVSRASQMLLMKHIAIQRYLTRVEARVGRAETQVAFLTWAWPSQQLRYREMCHLVKVTAAMKHRLRRLIYDFEIEKAAAQDRFDATEECA